jgi:hypothetical protein
MMWNMDSTSTDKDTINAAMNLAGAILVFVATVSAIVNNRLQKAKNAEHRERIISNILAFGCFGLCAASFVVDITVHSYPLIIWLLAASMATYIVKFLYDKAPASKIEIVILVIWATFVSWMSCMYAVLKLGRAIVGKAQFDNKIAKEKG